MHGRSTSPIPRRCLFVAVAVSLFSLLLLSPPSHLPLQLAIAARQLRGSRHASADVTPLLACRLLNCRHRRLLPRALSGWSLHISMQFRCYYVSEAIMRQATNFSRDNLVSLGTRLGKFSKKGVFRLHVTALTYIAPYAKYKVWIKPNQEQSFLYGNHVLKGQLCVRACLRVSARVCACLRVSAHVCVVVCARGRVCISRSLSPPLPLPLSVRVCLRVCVCVSLSLSLRVCACVLGTVPVPHNCAHASAVPHFSKCSDTCVGVGVCLPPRWKPRERKQQPPTLALLLTCAQW